MAWTLCTKDDVKALYPILDAELKDAWSDMVEGFIREELGQRYLGSLQPILNELRSGDGSPILHVKYPPIHSVSSLLINGRATSASDFYVNRNYIQLKNGVFPSGNLNVDVSYESGELEILETVRLCAATMIVAMANYKRRFGSDGSLKWASTETRTGEEDANSRVGLISHLKSIMKETLKKTVVRVR